MQPIHETLAGTLKRLRNEESFLTAVIERSGAGSSADADVLEAHHSSLARVRRSIDQLLPEASRARRACLQRLQELRPQVQAIRNLLEQLQAQAGARAVAPESAAARSRALQMQLDQVQRGIAVREREIGILDCHVESRAVAAGAEGGVATASACRERSAVPVLAAQASVRPKHPAAAALLPRDWRGTAWLGDGPLDDGLDMSDLAPDPAPDEAGSHSLDAEDETLPALGEPIEAAYRDEYRDSLRHRSHAVFTTGTRERRECARYAHVSAVKLRAGGLRFVGRSADLSRSGMFIETATSPEPGTTVAVFFCAEGYPVELDATVVHSAPGLGVGVQFRAVPEEERPHLEALLQQLQAGS